MTLRFRGWEILRHFLKPLRYVNKKGVKMGKIQINNKLSPTCKLDTQNVDQIDNGKITRRPIN